MNLETFQRGNEDKGYFQVSKNSNFIFFNISIIESVKYRT